MIPEEPAEPVVYNAKEIREKYTRRRKKKRSKWNNVRTVYNGITFRSKLETYCAKAFDRLHVQWIYEPKLNLGNGRMVMPDFYLPTHDCFVEIRPEKLVDEALIEKIQAIQEQYAKRTMLVYHQREIPAMISHLRQEKYYADRPCEQDSS